MDAFAGVDSVLVVLGITSSVIVGGTARQFRLAVFVSTLKGCNMLNKTKDTTIDCRSEEGLTIGLIDSILTAASLLVSREMQDPAIREAIEDLRQSPELRELLWLDADLPDPTLVAGR